MHSKTELIGYVGKDPEIHTFADGNTQASFSLATSESWRDRQSGERKTHTEWHNCVVRGKLADTVQRYVKSGSFLLLIGQNRTRKCADKNGTDKYITEVHIRELKFMPMAKKDENTQQKAAADLDDEIPF